MLNMSILCMKKWKICNVVLKRITHKTRLILESMCQGGMCFLDVDDMWDCLSLWVGINGTFILLFCALVVNLWTMMRILGHIIIFLMTAMLDSMP